MSMPSQQTPATPQIWTVLSMIEWSRDYLTQRGFDEARLHAELLLARVLKLSRLQLYLQFDRPLTAPELASYREVLKRRLNHEPLQYILGETEFMGITLEVGAGVLIPRPETELLVERALVRMKEIGKPDVQVLDIGLGSGNIALAIAHHARNASVTGVDVSQAAIAWSARNAQTLGLNINCIHGDVFDTRTVRGTYDLIAANPPYIPKAEFETLMPEVRLFEPREALTDEADGYGFLRRLAPRVTQLLKPGGIFLCEIGHGQEMGAKEIVGGAGFRDVAVHKDYAGIPRVVEADQLTIANSR